MMPTDRSASSVIVALVVLLSLTLVACGGGASEPTPVPATEAPAPTEPAALQGDAVAGAAVYTGTCVACHGPDARGVQGLGKSLHPSESEFVASLSDEELVEYIKVGRTPDDPLNTTGIGMPARGGNPALTDQDLYDVVSYIRTLD